MLLENLSIGVTDASAFSRISRISRSTRLELLCGSRMVMVLKQVACRFGQALAAAAWQSRQETCAPYGPTHLRVATRRRSPGATRLHALSELPKELERP